MTTIKTLVSAGALLAVAGVVLAADPGIKVLPAGAKSGSDATVVVKATMGTATLLQSAGVQLKYDNTKAAFKSVAAGPDWLVLSSNDDAGTVKVALAPAAGKDGQTADGVLCTATFTVNGNSKLTLLTASAVTDGDWMDHNPPATQDAALINGAIAQVGPMAGAPSVGFDKKIAVAAGGSLKLLSSVDLAPVAGFAAPAVGASSGRPAFGMIGADAVVAVGDDAGALTIAKVSDGTVVFTKVLGAKVSTPAIDSVGGIVYAAVTNASGVATLYRVSAGTESVVASLAGNTVLGAPAFFGGKVAVGTEKGVEVFLAVDGTPSAGNTDAAGATIAPLLDGVGNALSANATSILRFSAVTGNPPATGAVEANPAGALSEGWLDGGTAVFGTPSGKILSVGLVSGTPALAATALATAGISAEPIVLGTTTWAIDANGVVVSSAGDSLALAGPSAKAVAATGRTPGTDSIVAATADGTLAAIAF